MRIFWLPITLVVTTMLACLCSSAQDFSNKGREFWLAYCYHVGMINPGGPPTMTLYITSDLATTYTVEVFGGAVLQTGSIGPGQVVTAVVPATYFINDEGSFTKRAIHVTSAKPVVVYAYITRSQASGATLCLPTPVLGKEYYSMNFTQVSNEPNSNSYVTIVAVEDNTVVQITPAADTKNGWLANSTHTVNLNKGDVYQVLGALDRNDDSKGVDLTGTYIKSISSGTGGCKKIAVFSGSGKVRIPENCNSTSSDNLYQQLYPTGSWGLKYLTAPSYNNPYNYYRIAKSNPAANVYVNGVLVPPASFTNGIWYQFFNNKPNLIESDLPISVAQYFTTQGCDGNSAPYDPDMIILNPLEQNIDRVTLVSSNLYAPGVQVHHLQVVITNGGTALSSFRLDGQPVSGWTVHPADSKYSYVYLANVAQGYHTLSSDSGFNALAYGYASAESYGYSAGANVKDLYQFISIKNQYATVNFPASCKNSPFNFSMTFPYQPTQIAWNFSGLFPDTTLVNPVYDSTWVVNGRRLYRYQLPDHYTIPAVGIYPIQVLAQNPTADGCSGEQEIDYDLQVFDPPVADFTFTSNGCLTDSVHFLSNASTSGRNIIKQAWAFGDGTASSVQNPVHLYSTANAYTVRYAVITDVGCLSDTVRKTIPIALPPVANFTVSMPACEDRALTFSDQSSASPGASLARWTWDFGDGTPKLVAASSSSPSHAYTSQGLRTVSLYVETSSGCRSAAATRQIEIHSNPLAKFSFTSACLPAADATFTDRSSIPAGSVSQWLWDFGDGTTSGQQNPVHRYSSAGPFNVRLLVTSSDGCTDDSVMIMNKVFAQPMAAFSAPTEICLGSAASFSDQSIAPANVVALWYWDFGDGTFSTLQNPVKSYSAAGTYAVTLVAGSAAGCSSGTISKNIVVDPLPAANFDLSLPNCVDQDITFTDASAAGAGHLVKWKWDFGDGNSSILAAHSPFAHRYLAAGNYNSSLQVETDRGCVSNIFSRQVTINPIPVADFLVPGNCLKDPFSLFKDTSSISDGTQSAFTYQWTFGDPNANGANPNTSSVKDPQHKYTAAGSYDVTEAVTSGNGCVSSNTKTFFVNGSTPVPLFSLKEGASVCSGDTVHLTDQSTVTPGKLIRLEIFWDYANDPTEKTIDDSPSQGKIYAHTYPELDSPASKTVTVRYVAYSGQTCAMYIDTLITLKAKPSLQFDPLQGVCKNVPAFEITQARVLNQLPGSGTFTGPGVSPGGSFDPAQANEGPNRIRYTYKTSDGCTNYNEQSIEVFPVPLADAGPDKFVLEGGEVMLTPVVRVNYPVTYVWTPSTWLNNAEIQTPESQPKDDITYTLTVISDKGCSSFDNVAVKVLKTIRIPNIFSPNGDGIHDTWDIPYLASYAGCVVDVYNRYGQLIFHSVGYDKPWDGQVNGNPAPVGTYYFIIDPKNGRQKTSGYVDIIR